MIKDDDEKRKVNIWSKKITLEEGRKVFYSIREQLSDVPEMSPDEIDELISEVRSMKKGRMPEDSKKANGNMREVLL